MIKFTELCGKGFAYHSGDMVNDNAPAKTAEKCQVQCAATPSCKFWDFGEEFCRLRSNIGPRGKVAHSGYSFGAKYCKFGKTL